MEKAQFLAFLQNQNAQPARPKRESITFSSDDGEDWILVSDDLEYSVVPGQQSLLARLPQQQIAQNLKRVSRYISDLAWPSEAKQEDENSDGKGCEDNFQRNHEADLIDHTQDQELQLSSLSPYSSVEGYTGYTSTTVSSGEIPDSMFQSCLWGNSSDFFDGLHESTLLDGTSLHADHQTNHVEDIQNEISSSKELEEEIESIKKTIKENKRIREANQSVSENLFEWSSNNNSNSNNNKNNNENETLDKGKEVLCRSSEDTKVLSKLQYSNNSNNNNNDNEVLDKGKEVLPPSSEDPKVLSEGQYSNKLQEKEERWKREKARQREMLEAEKRKKRASTQPAPEAEYASWWLYSALQLSTSPKQIESMRVVPMSISLPQARKTFEEWRSSLWFAPTNFSQIVTEPCIKIVYIPYYCVSPTTLSSYRASIKIKAPHLPESDLPSVPSNILMQVEKDPSTLLSEKEKEWRQVTGKKEKAHKVIKMPGFEWEGKNSGSSIAQLVNCVDDWDMEFSISFSDLRKPSGEQNNVKELLNVQTLMDAPQVWKSIEKDIIERQRVSCLKKLLLDVNKEEAENYTRNEIKDFVLTNVVFTETKYKVIYVPMYIFIYKDDYDINNKKNYLFLLNAQTGKCDGNRPYGMGKFLGKGLKFLEGVFGVRGEDSVNIVHGKVLIGMDQGPYYNSHSYYLVFPPSHSYIIKSSTGFITIRNISKDFIDSGVDIELRSQRRESKETSGSYLLGSGEVSSFDYKGNWCIELSIACPQKQKANQDNSLSPCCCSICSSFSVSKLIRVEEVNVDSGGVYGDKLHMN